MGFDRVGYSSLTNLSNCVDDGSVHKDETARAVRGVSIQLGRFFFVVYVRYCKGISPKNILRLKLDVLFLEVVNCQCAKIRL